MSLFDFLMAGKSRKRPIETLPSMATDGQKLSFAHHQERDNLEE